MIFTAGNILLIGSILLFVSIIVGKAGYRFGVPALLLFLVVGMLFGRDWDCSSTTPRKHSSSAWLHSASFCSPVAWTPSLRR